MARNPLVRSPVTNWTQGSTVLPVELNLLDSQLAQGVNGVGGSTHAPTSQGVFNGSGIVITGPSVVARGGQLVSTVAFGIGTGVTLGDNDVEQYAPGHIGSTRTRLEPLVSGQPLNDPFFNAYHYLSVAPPAWIAGQAHAIGDSVVPRAAPNGQFYQATAITTGISDPATEPAWPITFGATVVDAGVTWTCRGAEVLVSTSFPWAESMVWRARWVDTGLQALASSIDFSDGLGQRTLSWQSPLRAFDTSTLSSVVVTFRVKTPHTQVPSTMPRVRVTRTENITPWAPVLSHVIGDIVIPLASPNGFFYRATSVTGAGGTGLTGSTEPTWPKTLGATVTDSHVVWTCAGTAAGNGSVAPLTSVAAGADANGFVAVPTPTSAFAWNNRGQAQTLTIPCDQNNTVAIGSYVYSLEIAEEQGLTGYPWQLVCKQPVVAATFAPVGPLQGVQVIDGIRVGNNSERVLVAGGIIPGSHWIASDAVSTGYLLTATRLGLSNQMAWRCTTAGVTGEVEPFWPPQVTGCFTWSTGVTVPGTNNLYAIPSAKPNGYFYRCTTSGATGALEPVWPTSVGATVTDGTATWTCWGVLSTPSIGTQITDGTVVWTAVALYTIASAYVPDYAANGIWIASTGTWQRAKDLVSASDFTQGMLIPIALGNSMAGSVVQASSSITSWTPGVTPVNFVARVQDDDETPISAGAGFFAHGIVWHSMQPTFTGLTQNNFE